MRDDPDTVRKFVKIVEKHPILYSYTRNSFKSRPRRPVKLAWMKIADSVTTELNEKCTVEELKLKWKGIRCNYMKYVNRMFYKKGSDIEKYYMCDALMFMDPFMKPKTLMQPTSSEIASEETTDEPPNSLKEICRTVQCQPHLNKTADESGGLYISVDGSGLSMMMTMTKSIPPTVPTVVFKDLDNSADCLESEELDIKPDVVNLTNNNSNLNKENSDSNKDEEVEDKNEETNSSEDLIYEACTSSVEKEISTTDVLRNEACTASAIKVINIPQLIGTKIILRKKACTTSTPKINTSAKLRNETCTSSATEKISLSDNLRNEICTSSVAKRINLSDNLMDETCTPSAAKRKNLTTVVLEKETSTPSAAQNISPSVQNEASTVAYANRRHYDNEERLLYRENGDLMYFFRSIIPDIKDFSPKEKRNFKIGVIGLIDVIFNQRQQ